MSNPTYIPGGGEPALGCDNQAGFLWTPESGSVSRTVRTTQGSEGVDPNSSVDGALIAWWVAEVEAAFVDYEPPGGFSDYELYWYWNTSSASWNADNLEQSGNYVINASPGWEIGVVYCPADEAVSSSSSTAVSETSSSTAASLTTTSESSIAEKSSSSSTARSETSSSSSSESTVLQTTSSSSSTVNSNTSSSNSVSSTSSSSISVSSDSSSSSSSFAEETSSSSSRSTKSSSSTSWSGVDSDGDEDDLNASSSSDSLGHSASSSSSSSEVLEAHDLPIVAGYNLLPHQANWMKPPTIVRAWRSSVDASLDGDEDRISVRPVAWKTLTYEVMPYDHVERARFEARFKAGLLAGKLAVPSWGYGVQLESAVSAGDTVLTLTRNSSAFAAGKCVFIQTETPADYEIFDFGIIDSKAANVLTLATGLNHGYDAGTKVWPILFGRPLPETFEPMSATRARFTVSIKYDARQVSAFAYDDFSEYPLGAFSELNGGTGWAGPWVRHEAA